MDRQTVERVKGADEKEEEFPSGWDPVSEVWAEAALDSLQYPKICHQ